MEILYVFLWSLVLSLPIVGMIYLSVRESLKELDNELRGTINDRSKQRARDRRD